MRKLSDTEQKLFDEFRAERKALSKHLPKIIQGKIEAREFKLGNKPEQEGWYFVMHFGSVANQIYMDDAYWDNEKWHGFKNEEIFAYIPIDEKINEIVPELYADFADEELFGKSFEEKEHLKLLKEMFIQTFNSPKGHPKTKPFYDHQICFYNIDNQIFIRVYQILNEIKYIPKI